LNPKHRSKASASGQKSRTGAYGPYRPGRSPEQDAWFTAFFIENHLDHFTHPDHAASPEQVRFMVFTDEDVRYYPCSQRMFESIMGRKRSDFMHTRYRETLDRVTALIAEQIEDDYEREYLEALIRIKYQHEIRDQIMIPSRLEKRLIRIFLNRTQIEDPYVYEKQLRNRRMHRALHSDACRQALNRLEAEDLQKVPRTLQGVREMADFLELQRLFSLACEPSLWQSDAAESLSEADFRKLLRHPMYGNGVEPLMEFLEINAGKEPASRTGKKILWLADESGEVVLDLAIIQYLNQLGHRVILVFKDGPLYTKTDFAGIRNDEILSSALKKALLIQETELSKNELVRRLRSDYAILAVSDGTRENLNLLLASTSFARAFKEVDGVISRGPDQKRRLFDTPFRFTQDIYSIVAGKDGVEITFKARHPAVIKFSHADLESRARAIIDQMATAKKQGMTVVFYSGIIGSIPGRIRIAKKVMSTFIQYLKDHSEQTFIINPSEFFEPGMDADDLMYMWEIVQRSGLIDIWRFQTYGDIVKAFELLEQKVPPEWVGKDATFSTGCTKEMAIAQEVQKQHPEMQIIGPSADRFMRRHEYGIGKMYDSRLGSLMARPGPA